MANHVPIFNDPVELAVKTLVQGSHLTNMTDFIPIKKVYEIKEGDSLPVVTCETLDYIIKEDGVNASTGFLITIWDYFPEAISQCQTEEDIHVLAVETIKGYAEDLLEITQLLVGDVGDRLFEDADYTLQGDRILLPRYKRSAFDSKVEAKNSKMGERLIGASIQGRLAGHIKWVCCTKGNFEID